jgi:uncharacterized protein (TIGR03382 family)
MPSSPRRALLLMTAVIAHAALGGEFTLVPVANDGTLPSARYNGDNPAISANGRIVVFRSSETHLVTPATSGYQIFLRDLTLGTTELISRNDQGAAGNNSSDFPSVSNDGCRVVFESDSTNLVAADGNGSTDVFLRDRCASTPTTVLVSVSSGGVQGNGQSKRAWLSGNGAVVAFWSYANNLVPGTPNPSQIYLRTLATQTTQLISDNTTGNGKGGNYGTDCPMVSEDGSKLVFWSLAYDLSADDTYDVWDIYFYDANATPHLRRASSSSAGVPQNIGGNGLSSVTCPAISADGTKVAWSSWSTNLVPNDTNDAPDIFVKDMPTGTLTRASVSSTGAQGTAGSRGRPSLSSTGRWVAFSTLAPNLAAEAQGKTPTVALHDLTTGATVGVGAFSSSSEPVLSPDVDGTYLVADFGEKLDPAHLAEGLFRYSRSSSQPPVARATASPSSPLVNQVVTLDGSASSDPEGQALTFTWSQITGPSVVLSSPRDARPTFTPTTAGRYEFRLVVSDGQVSSAPVVVSLDVLGSTTEMPASGCTSVPGSGPVLLLVLAALWRRRG